MSLLALGLILLAAFVHAIWNLLAKRVGGGAPLVWLFAALASLLYLPVAPAREVSILIGAWLGARVLGEGEAQKRLLAACAMAAGVVLLVLG